LSATAAAMGLVPCRACGQLNRARPGARTCCARCGSELRLRKPEARARTIALLGAAYVL